MHFNAWIWRGSSQLQTGIILYMCPANERRRCTVTSSLIGWAHTKNDPCSGHGWCQTGAKSLPEPMLTHGQLNSRHEASVKVEAQAIFKWWKCIWKYDVCKISCSCLCVFTVHWVTLHWRHNDHDDVSNHQPHGCLLNLLSRHRSNKTSKLRVTGLCVGNSPGPVNSPRKGPVTRKMFPFDDVIMMTSGWMAVPSIKMIV